MWFSWLFCLGCNPFIKSCSQAKAEKLPPLCLKKNTAPSGPLTDGIPHYICSVLAVIVHVLKLVEVPGNCTLKLCSHTDIMREHGLSIKIPVLLLGSRIVYSVGNQGYNNILFSKGVNPPVIGNRDNC